MTKEQIYAEQMRDLGIYDKAFEPEIHTLAILEREHQRTMKEWKATAEDGRAPSAADKLYTVRHWDLRRRPSSGCAQWTAALRRTASR